MINITDNNNIVTLRLNRPEKRNALSMELIDAIHAGLDRIEQIDSMQVFILAGAGSSFCAGMDLRGILQDPTAIEPMLHGLGRIFQRIRRLPVPTIACVQGAAIGGGCGLMVVCDFAFTHAESTVGFPEVDLGVCPAVVAPWVIKKLGAGKARAMLLAGGTISGKQGFEAGLATHLCAADELESATEAFALNLARGGKGALAVTKQWLNELDGSLDEAVLDQAAVLSAEVVAGEEALTRLRPLYEK